MNFLLLSILSLLVHVSCVDTVIDYEADDASVKSNTSSSLDTMVMNSPNINQGFDLGSTTNPMDQAIASDEDQTIDMADFIDMEMPIDITESMDMIVDMEMVVDMEILEICNQEDDDQDGQVDEGLLNSCGQCPNEVVDEVCDGVDNDCDQEIDEDSCPCPSIIYQDSIYLLCPTRSSWPNADAFCGQYDFQLTSIQSEAENDALFTEMENQQFSDTWIGLTDQNQEGNFIWSDNQPMNYTRWGRGEPNDGGGGEDCGIILMENRASRWDDRRCSREYSFICERLIP